MHPSEYRNYWLDTVVFSRGTTGEVPHERDVVIIGAGIHRFIRGVAVSQTRFKRCGF